jgi:2-succinyl-6-hydroxy-2,4-cyclohexadiene-1-carboxylate synthase
MGQSDAPDLGYGMAIYAADLAALLDTLGVEEVILCGHSMGGHNAMAFAGWHPDRVRALVIIDSRPAMPSERLSRMHRRGHRGLRRHETREGAHGGFEHQPQCSC